MHDTAIGGYVISALLFAGAVYCMYLAGRMAERRGRNFRTWAGVAAVIGPLALPLLFLFSNLRRGNPQGPARPNGEKPSAETTGAPKPLSRGNSDSGHLEMSFA
jgi:MFS family permease